MTYRALAQARLEGQAFFATMRSFLFSRKNRIELRGVKTYFVYV